MYSHRDSSIERKKGDFLSLSLSLSLSPHTIFTIYSYAYIYIGLVVWLSDTYLLVHVVILYTQPDVGEKTGLTKGFSTKFYCCYNFLPLKVWRYAKGP